MDIDGV
jgi:hypothetical protein